MNKDFEKLEEYSQKRHALVSALTLFNWDNSTYGAPKKAIGLTAQDMGVLNGEVFALTNSDEFKDLIKSLSGADDLSSAQKAMVREYARDIERLENIPAEEYKEYSILLAKAYPVWEEAKLKNDYELYAPVLKQIIDTTKRFCNYRKKDGFTLYEVALDDYEPGFKEKMLDDFFGLLKEKVLPIVKKHAEKNEKEPEFMTTPVKEKVQKALAKYIAEYIGFDFDRGVLAETEHPFTTNLHNHDVRITTHYYEDHWTFSLFSTIHEGGHALYEQGIADDITMTNIGTGASLGLHESQSRFYENNIGRGRHFWEPIYDKLAKDFLPFLSNVSLDEFYKGINFATPSLIRTEADELTYPFHIIIRYEIEKMIFEGDVDVNELPAIWNAKYKEYLGIEPKDYTTGILQDMHWSGGSFGYFPTYAIGTSVAAQLYRHMKDSIDIENLLIKGDMEKIRSYLGEHIHRFGMEKNTEQVLNALTGEGFNPNYYVEYLTKKFA